MSRTDPIRILSVDDHPVFREGLSTIITSQQDMALIAQAANALEAVTEFRRHRPDITLMDLRLPGTNGTDTLIAIRGEFPRARIIMLTTSDSDGEIQRAMRAGASGYILKSTPKNELLAVIRAVHGGKRHIPAEVAARIAEHLEPPEDWRRPDELGCTCRFCRELSTFLADPVRRTWALKSLQVNRSHVETEIRNCHCDVDTKTLRQGSPHSLFCTKNQASYERRARQRKKDLEHLSLFEEYCSQGRSPS